jgi:hypothetical protein
MIYRDQIEALAVSYAAATSKPAKMQITRKIVETMQQTYGSRFLREVSPGGAATGGSWIALTDQQARDKTSHALRFHLKNNPIHNNSNNDALETRQVSIEQQHAAATMTAAATPPFPQHPTGMHALAEAASQQQQQQQQLYPSTTNTTKTTTMQSQQQPPMTLPPISDPMYALLQRTMFVTKSPFVMHPCFLAAATAASSSSSTTNTANDNTPNTAIPNMITTTTTAMEVDPIFRTNTTTNNNSDRSLMTTTTTTSDPQNDASLLNGNTLRSEDLNALFNSSMSSMEALMVLSVNGSDTHSTGGRNAKTDTLRSEDFNRLFHLEEHEWDAAMAE